MLQQHSTCLFISYNTLCKMIHALYYDMHIYTYVPVYTNTNKTSISDGIASTLLVKQDQWLN